MTTNANRHAGLGCFDDQSAAWIRTAGSGRLARDWPQPPIQVSVVAHPRPTHPAPVSRESRISDFLEAVDRCLELMRDHGNPGLERFTLKTFEGRTLIRPGGLLSRRAWRLGSNPGSVMRILAPSGEFADFWGIGWHKA